MDKHLLYIYTPAVFVHFLASAMAIAAMLSVDLKYISGYRKQFTPEFMAQLRNAGKVISIAIPILWVTGIYFVIWGGYTDGGFLANEKLIFKIVAVSIISLNGILIGTYVRDFRVGDVLAKYSPRKRIIILATSTLSTVSWLWASYVGVAKTWNFVMPFWQIANLYVLSWILTMCVVIVAIRWRN